MDDDTTDGIPNESLMATKLETSDPDFESDPLYDTWKASKPYWAIIFCSSGCGWMEIKVPSFPETSAWKRQFAIQDLERLENIKNSYRERLELEREDPDVLICCKKGASCVVREYLAQPEMFVRVFKNQFIVRRDDLLKNCGFFKELQASSQDCEPNVREREMLEEAFGKTNFIAVQFLVEAISTPIELQSYGKSPFEILTAFETDLETTENPIQPFISAYGYGYLLGRRLQLDHDLLDLSLEKLRIRLLAQSDRCGQGALLPQDFDEDLIREIYTALPEPTLDVFKAPGYREGDIRGIISDYVAMSLQNRSDVANSGALRQLGVEFPLFARDVLAHGAYY